MNIETFIVRLGGDLESVISLAEECRWHFPELSEQADELVDAAMTLFRQSIGKLQAPIDAQ